MPVTRSRAAQRPMAGLARLFIACFLLHLTISAKCNPSSHEYAIQKYLSERSLWLRSMYNISDIDLDTEIQNFALPESDSTVRYIQLQFNRKVSHNDSILDDTCCLGRLATTTFCKQEVSYIFYSPISPLQLIRANGRHLP